MEVFFIVIAQAFFSATDYWKKLRMAEIPFGWKLLFDPSFVASNVVAGLGFLLFMYVLSKYELSRSVVTLGVSAAFFSLIFGVFLLGERITPLNGVGYALAIAAIVLINLK